jgi:dihydrodipicolinate synthase/N-acetylneuraminate lyase
LISELAQHSNIFGIKDSSGYIKRIGSIVTATLNALRRTVTVTPIFEA